MKFKFIILFMLFSGVSQAETVTENFSSISHYDPTNSTGYWNIVDQRAQAAVVSGATASLALGFGTGGLGALNVSSGSITFDTNANSGGFNYSSISITGTTTVTIQGNNPLILRSLGAVTISRNLTFSGGNATDGLGGGAGGTSVATGASGGAGGTVSGTPQNGSNGGGAAFGAGGAGVANIAANANNGNPEGTGYDATQFFVAGFISKGGGGGGGAHTDGGVVSPVTGGGGGASGGMFRLIAGGVVSITGAMTANGGDGATGMPSMSGFCSGAGAGGGGGAVWIQSYKGVTTTDPTLNAGNGGAACGTLGAASNGLPGDARVDNDTATGMAAAAGNITVVTATQNAAASQTYFIYSTGYDTGFENPKYNSASVTSNTPGISSVLVEYAGSPNNADYSFFTANITDLANKNYRFFKFRITLTTHNAAAVSPHVSNLTVDYGWLPALGAVPDQTGMELSAGCGLLKKTQSQENHSEIPTFYLMFWILVWANIYLSLRYFLP